MRIITGIAAPWDTPTTHPGRAFQLSSQGTYAVKDAADLVLEHESSPRVIGRLLETQLTDPCGILVRAEVHDDALDLTGLAFSVEIAPWDMTQVGGIHVLTAGTIRAVALTRCPAFPGTSFEVDA